jgi:hypothetical protein
MSTELDIPGFSPLHTLTCFDPKIEQLNYPQNKNK